MLRETLNLKVILKSIIIQITVTVISILFFAAVMYFTELDFSYASLLGTLSVALGIFVASYYLAKTAGERGFIIGLVYSIIIFLLVMIVSLILSSDFTLNTLFHLLIYVMSGLIGGVFAVNKSRKKKFYK